MDSSAPSSKWNRQRKWKYTFIILTILIVIFYVLGGALIGSSVGTCTQQYYDTYYDAYDTSYYNCVNRGQFWAGWAFLIISIILSVVWLVFLILRFTSWYRKGMHQAPVIYQPSQYGNTQPSQYANNNVQHAPASTAPVAGEAEKMPPSTTAASEAAPQNMCLHCEHPTAGGAFCSNCGKVQ